MYDITKSIIANIIVLTIMDYYFYITISASKLSLLPMLKTIPNDFF